MKRFFPVSFTPLFLGLLLLLSLVGSLLTPLLAYGVSFADPGSGHPYDGEIILRHHGSSTEKNITNSWTQYITTDDPEGVNSCSADIRQAFLDKQNWAVKLNINYQGASAGTVQSLRVLFSVDPRTDIKGVFQDEPTAGYYRYGLNKLPRYIADLEMYNGKIYANCYDGNEADAFFTLSEYYYQDTSINATAPRVLMNTWDTEYPEGYEGQAIPGTAGEAKPTIAPEISYTIVNKKVTLKYEDNIPHQSCPVMDWTYNRSDATAEQLGSEFDTPPLQVKEWEVPSYGKYTFLANLRVPVPCAPFPSDKEVIAKVFTLDIDGTSFSGSTSEMTCEDTAGNYNGCFPPELAACPNGEGVAFITTATCRFEKSMNLGIINPSITAFKDLFGSFIVPTNPSCHIPITDVKLMGTQSFPLSSLSGYACDNAEDFRSAFPIAPIIANFLLALWFFYLIVRIINVITDNKRNDIIEGVAP